MGMVQKHGKWVPLELKSGDVEHRFFLLQTTALKKKVEVFLLRIVTGDEKWIHYNYESLESSFGGV